MTGLLLACVVVVGVRSFFSPCSLSLLTKVNPVLQRARGRRYVPQAVVFLFFSTASGLGLGYLFLGLALLRQRFVSSVPSYVAVSLVALASVADLLSRSNGVIVKRQLNEAWLDAFRPTIYSAGYGLQLGFCYATYYTTAALLVLPFLEALHSPGAIQVASGVALGAVRGLQLAVPGAFLSNRARMLRLARWVVEKRLYVRKAAGAALLLAATVSLGQIAILAPLISASVLLAFFFTLPLSRRLLNRA